MTDPTANDTVWPPTSERDAHLGAYARDPNVDPPWLCPQCRDDRHRACPVIAFDSGNWRRCRCQCNAWIPETNPAVDPAPAGLTAAQEIRLRLVEMLDLTDCPTVDEFTRRWPQTHPVLRELAGWVEHGDGMTREQLAVAMAERGVPDPAACPDPAEHRELFKSEQARAHLRVARDDLRAQVERLLVAVCPDPALHEETHPLRVMAGQAAAARDEALARVADLKTDLLEAHADLEASLAREQIAAERIAELRPLVLELIGTDSENGLAGTTPRMLRVILAGDQGEEAAFGVINEPYPAKEARA